MEYSELEKKVITNGYRQFRKELEKASTAMIPILKKYKLYHGNDLLSKITLTFPYREDWSQSAVDIPNDVGLESLDKTILDMFLEEVKSIKEITDNLNF